MSINPGFHYCSSCGEQLDPVAKFCTHCGEQVESSPVDPADAESSVGMMICEREECGYEGTNPKEASRWESLWAALLGASLPLSCGCGCFGLLIFVAGMALGMTLLGDQGWVVGVIFLLLPFIGVGVWAWNSKPVVDCPACRRGLMVDINSERGQALLQRKWQGRR